MKTNFKRIGKQSISIVLAVMMMLSTMLVGMVTSNAANETGYTYNQDYMYVDLSAISKVASGVNYYWDDAFTNYGGWITDKEDLGNYTYKFDFSAIVSHEYFRGFKIVWAGSAGTNIAVPANNNYNCVKVNSDYTLSWTTYSSTEPTEPTTKYTVTVDKNIKNGKVTPSAASLAAGETFTVTVTPDNGYVLNAITVTDADGKSVAATDESTHTYTMPASNVTVSATFKVKTDAKYSVTYTAPTGEGVVDSSINPTDTALAEGTNVTVTVTVNDGYTASLAVDGATVTTSTSGNTYTFTFSMPAQAITVAPKVTKAGENTGTLIPNLYLIYTTKDEVIPTNFTQHLNLYYDSNNQVYASFNENTSFDTSKTYKFMISTLKGENSFRGTANYNKDNPKVYVTTTDGNSILADKNTYGYTDNGVYAQYVYGWFSVKGESRDTVSSVKINLGYYKDGKIQESAKDTSYAYTYEVIPTSGVEGMVQVFAKDGTIRATYQKYADMADTVLTAENTTDLTKYAKKDYYDTAYANVGTKLKITTTIGEGYREKYFVKAFSINGYSYGIIDASQADTTDGVYTCEYTIPEDFEGSRIEITPIYYYIDDTDTVTFYVEGFDKTVQDKWGNTVAVQAWYANGEEKEQFEKAEFNSLTKNALGGYPGQPLVYEGGKYSMQIPKYLNGNKTLTVKGITLNNYFWDDIHKQSFSDKSDKSESNCQTYDYDDFYKLSETADVDNIIFDFRYRTTTDNKPSMDGLTKSTYNPNELEPLKDYSGNIVDIFGNFLSKEWTDDYNSEYLTVISDGYKENENIGTYATEWSVYDHDGKYITTINCSSLIDESKVDSTYQAAYDKLKPYAKLPVKIAYEMSKFAGYHKGTRADGRWYFSQKAQKITANVKIEYGADVNSEFNVDEFEPNSNVGTVTRAKAYFTNADYNGKTTCEGAVDGGNFSVHAQTDANANYYFLGWYLKTSDGGYSLITTESDTDIPMTNNATYVARFINTPSGTLTLSHTLLTGSADGKTFIKADIVDSANNVKASIDETSGNLVIPSKYVTYTSTYIIRLTLRTVPYGNDTVEDFYEGYSGNTPNHYNATLTGTGEQTYSVERAISSLFEKIDNTDGSVSYKLKKSNIPFYSNITSNPLEYKITYTYKTRLNGEQSYVIKDKVSGIELEQMWADNVAAGLKDKEQLSKAFITKKAPFVSNYREEIRWNMDAADIKGYTATVSANTSTVDLKIYALTVAGQWTQPATVKYGELAMSSDGDYLYKTGTTEFPEKFNYSGTTKYDFSFWAIFDNKEKADQYSKAVAEYMSGTPAADMSQRLTALTQLGGYDNLISKSYSKEYNYISYQDYYIVPVYAGRFAKSEIKESQASIRLLEYTRNQWTTGDGVKGDGETLNTGATKTDYLYTDFALSFDKDQELIKNNDNIRVGIAFEIVAKYDNVDLKTYVTDSDTDAIGSAVKNAKANGKVGYYTFENANRNIYRYEIDNSTISTKNRIEYYLQFKNTANARQNVLKVYSYIYDKNSGNIYLSDPEYMNMYDIGNLTYITSNLANIDLQPAGEP
ncbi:InlB B-repeat-containing protein [Ruminococcus sp.]|uniref:InlB B-repeat-containing protein n=1 Tax=Ruminococcus sp. TaxID=41978 RepID=UPI003A8DC5E5